MNPELKLLKLKQKVYNMLIDFKKSKSPNNFLWGYTLSLPNNDVSSYNIMLDALDNDDKSLVMEYVSTLSDGNLNNLYDDLILRQNVYNALMDLKQSGSPFTFLISYITTLPFNNRIQLLNVISALNRNDNCIVVSYVSYMSDDDLNYLLDFFI